MYCSNCGSEIPNNSRFCGNCGNKIEQEPKELTQQDINKEPKENKIIKVIIKRMKKMPAWLYSMKIYIDNTVVANIKNGETVEVNATYGTHNIIMDIAGVANERKVEFLEEYTKVYIDIAMVVGVGSDKPEIVSIRNEK